MEYVWPNLITCEEMKEKIALQISTDEDLQYVSLNALNLFTRHDGLKYAIKALAEEVEEALSAERAHVNEEILSELFNIKSDLANREKDLDAREYGLSLRQSNFTNLQENIQTTLGAHAKKLYKDHAAKIAPKVNSKFEKIKAIERSISDKVNVFKAK